MAPASTVACTFHGSTFIEIAFGETVLFIDPVFASERRGRRVRGETRRCDYVLATEGGDSLDDALDVLEDVDDAVLVGTPRSCKVARSELELGKDRTLDLEPWERASDDGFKLTAVPISIASAVDEGLASIEDLALGAGRAGLGMGRNLGGAGNPLASALGSVPFVGQLTRPMTSALPNLLGAFTGSLAGNGLANGIGGGVLGPLSGLAGSAGLSRLGLPSVGRGRPGLGYLVEIDDGPSILHLGRGIHNATDEHALEEIAELGAIDSVIVDLSRANVASVVRAVRALDATFVVLYRSEDAYQRGRRPTQAPTASAFAEALAEDRGDDVEVQYLRKGDRYVLGPESAAAE
jgi:hypothetical protein